MNRLGLVTIGVGLFSAGLAIGYLLGWFQPRNGSLPFSHVDPPVTRPSPKPPAADWSAEYQRAAVAALRQFQGNRSYSSIVGYARLLASGTPLAPKYTEARDLSIAFASLLSTGAREEYGRRCLAAARHVRPEGGEAWSNEDAMCLAEAAWNCCDSEREKAEAWQIFCREARQLQAERMANWSNATERYGNAPEIDRLTNWSIPRR